MSNDIERLRLIIRSQRLSILLVLLLISVTAVVVFTQCGQPPAPVAENPQSNCLDGLAVGETRKELCPSGKGEKVLVCKTKGAPSEVLVPCNQDPAECKKVTFEGQIKPVVSQKCVSCHFTPESFESYSVASKYALEWIRRINLNSGDPRRMPRPPRPELTPEEKALFQKWFDEGLPNTPADCDARAPVNGFEGLNRIEKEIVIDHASLNKDERIFVRHVVSSVYKGPAFKKALDKVLNSLNRQTKDVIQSSFVGANKDILRFDLRSYGLDRTDWLRIEAKEPLNFVSNTDQGKFLRLVTATRKPWMHLENLIETISTADGLYNELADIPARFEDLAAEVGVDYDIDLKNADAALLGFTGSIIAKQKNRLMSRHQGDDGYFWVSYDSFTPQGIPERNLFRFPLLSETGSKDSVFDFAAREVLFALPNGFMGSALYDARGDIQQLAPLEIVQNLESHIPPAPEIESPVSCMQCHAKGILPAVDQIRASVLAPGSGLPSNDIERVRQLFRPQASMDALFRIDNAQHQAALAKIGIDPYEKDPVHELRQVYVSDYDADKLAALLFLTTPRFKELLSQSQSGRTQLGQLLTGGLASFDQIIDVLPDLLKDFRLLEEKDNAN